MAIFCKKKSASPAFIMRLRRSSGAIAKSYLVFPEEICGGLPGNYCRHIAQIGDVFPREAKDHGAIVIGHCGGPAFAP